MAITTARLRKQLGQRKRMLDLWKSKGTTHMVRITEVEIEDLEGKIAEREGKG